MSPSELDELRQPHRALVRDGLAVIAAAVVLTATLIFLGPVALAVISLILVIGAVTAGLMVAAGRADDVAERALQARRARLQEAQARENTRPYAKVIRFPERRS
jgi:NAD/NADP transhydrogenase alpha subunit